MHIHYFLPSQLHDSVQNYRRVTTRTTAPNEARLNCKKKAKHQVGARHTTILQLIFLLLVIASLYSSLSPYRALVLKALTCIRVYCTAELYATKIYSSRRQPPPSKGGIKSICNLSNGHVHTEAFCLFHARPRSVCRSVFSSQNIAPHLNCKLLRHVPRGTFLVGDRSSRKKTTPRLDRMYRSGQKL